MTQDQCLALPSHWTHEGVCYPGGNATIQLEGITMGGTTPTSAPELSVPEPSTLALFACAMLIVSSKGTQLDARREAGLADAPPTSPTALFEPNSP